MKKKRGEKKKHKERGKIEKEKKKKRKIFQYKRNNYSARDTVMVKEWSK